MTRDEAYELMTSALQASLAVAEAQAKNAKNKPARDSALKCKQQIVEALKAANEAC